MHRKLLDPVKLPASCALIQCLIRCLFACLAFAPSLLNAQQSPPSQPAAPVDSNSPHDPPSFSVQPDPGDDATPAFQLRTTTRRLVLDVVVTAPDGKPALGLTQQDFTVEEDHKPQSIRAFEVHTSEEDRSALPPGPTDLPGNTFINLEKVPESGPPIVIVLDFLNTPLQAQMYAHQQILRFLERKPASTQVAIFALADNLSLVQGFTTDREQLLTAMHSKAANPHLTSTSEQIQRAQTTLDAFLDMGTFLTSMKGRKNLLWFSGSFEMMVLPRAQDADRGVLAVSSELGAPNPGAGAVVTSANLLPNASATNSEMSSSGFSNGVSSMRVLADRLRKVATVLSVSQTSVYPIDVRGLLNDPQYSGSTGSPSGLSADARGVVGTPGMPQQGPGGSVTGPANVQSHNEFRDSLDAANATMQEIAEATGGHAFVNSNGILQAAEQAVSQGSSYYTLVYAPSNTHFDGSLRTIHVALDKPGYTLAYRSAYYAVDADSVAPETAGGNTLSAAMLHGAPEAHGLIFKAQIDPEGAPSMASVESPLAIKQPEKITKKMKKDPDFLSGMVQAYTLRLAIIAQQLQFTQLQDGRHRAALQIAVYAYAADGRKIGGVKQNLQAAMPPTVFARALQDGLYHRMQVELPVEAATLRLAIRDPESHRTGSLEIPLPIAPSQNAQSKPPTPGNADKSGKTPR